MPSVVRLLQHVHSTNAPLKPFDALASGGQTIVRNNQGVSSPEENT